MIVQRLKQVSRSNHSALLLTAENPNDEAALVIVQEIAEKDDREAGELDLADLIDCRLWDVACEAELDVLDSISDETWAKWLAEVRDILDRHGCNVYFKNGKVRKQEP